MVQVLFGAKRSINGVPQSPPVVGGSGRFYWTIADALAGEQNASETLSAQAVQGGTAVGSVVGPGTLSATNDFYKDYYVQNADTTPSNGLVSRISRVTAYNGTTKTLSIEDPWDFSGESTFNLINPIRITLNASLSEDVTLSGLNNNVILDLAGNRLEGHVLVNIATLLIVRGGGWITDGIEVTADNVTTVLDGVEVGSDPATTYALLYDQSNNLGRINLKDCTLHGKVAARRVRIGWDIVNSVATDTSGFPYRLAESLGAGSALSMVQFDASIDSDFSGAFFFSSGAGASITGATIFCDIHADVRTGGIPTFEGDTTRPRRVFFGYADGSATLTPTFTTGAPIININQTPADSLSGGSSSEEDATFAWLAADSFTGTATITMDQTVASLRLPTVTSVGGRMSMILITGSSDTSGALTVTGSAIMFNSVYGHGAFEGITFKGRLTGTATVSAAGLWIFDSENVRLMTFYVNQDSGTPTATFSSNTIVYVARNTVSTFLLRGSPTPTISVGTWTISGSIDATSRSYQNVLDTTVSGGTWSVSGTVAAFIYSSGSIVSIARHRGTGGTLTCTTTQRIVGPRAAGSVAVSHSTGAGGSVDVQGAVHIIGFEGDTNTALILASTATSTARLTGTLHLRRVTWTSSAPVILESTAVGSVAEGPSQITMDQVSYDSGSLTTETGSGTITWSGATLEMRNCYIDGTFTFVGTRFSTVETWQTSFNGSASNLSISASGSRPTTYRHWKPTFRARYFGLQPEVIRTHTVFQNDVALGRGSLATATATASIVHAVAQTAAGILRGVVLIATTGGADEAAILVQDGEVFVDVDAGVVAGDNLVVDTAGTPTEGIAGAVTPGNQVGIALEDASGGEAYSSVRIG